MEKKSKIFVDGLVFPESPRWHDGKLWFSDEHNHKVMTVDLEGKTQVVVEVPGSPAGLGWHPDGYLLVVSMSDRHLLKLDSKGLSVFADLSKLTPYKCNDMVVDKNGHAYVGHFGYDSTTGQEIAPASILSVSPEGEVAITAEDMLFPNGSVITPDGRTLIVAETLGLRLTAFNIEVDGSLTGRRTWAKLGESYYPGMSQSEIQRCIAEGVVPDGICLDAENAIWVANAFKNEVVRVREGGEITDRVVTTNNAYACMLGGSDRNTLFIMTAETVNPELARVKKNGRIETLLVDVPGAGLP